jgi:hypothetical protein
MDERHAKTSANPARILDPGLRNLAPTTSENDRRARFYTLTRSGRKELGREESEWRRIASAIMRILSTSPADGRACPAGAPRIPGDLAIRFRANSQLPGVSRFSLGRLVVRRRPASARSARQPLCRQRRDARAVLVRRHGRQSGLRLHREGLKLAAGIEVVVRRNAGVTRELLAEQLQSALRDYASRLPATERQLRVSVSGIESTPLGHAVSLALPWVLGGRSRVDPAHRLRERRHSRDRAMDSSRARNRDTRVTRCRTRPHRAATAHRIAGDCHRRRTARHYRHPRATRPHGVSSRSRIHLF